MKFHGVTLFLTLALTAGLSGAAAAAEKEVGQADTAGNMAAEVIRNNDINIDPDDIQGSLGQNILDLMRALGICNFSFDSIEGLGLSLGNEIQLLLQLQQLQQLQALGLVNSFAVDQLVQQEILSRNFNLNIIQRSISASVKQATKGKKRTTILRRQCKDIDRLQGGAGNLVGEENLHQAGQEKDQANQHQGEQDKAEQDQEEKDQEKQAEAEKEKEKENANENEDEEKGEVSAEVE